MQSRTHIASPTQITAKELTSGGLTFPPPDTPTFSQRPYLAQFLEDTHLPPHIENTHQLPTHPIEWTPPAPTHPPQQTRPAPYTSPKETPCASTSPREDPTFPLKSPRGFHACPHM